MRRPIDTFENLKSLYGELTGTAPIARPFPTCPVAADRSDPISPLLAGRTPLSAEVRLTSRCLDYLEIDRRTTPDGTLRSRGYSGRWCASGVSSTVTSFNGP